MILSKIAKFVCGIGCLSLVGCRCKDDLQPLSDVLMSRTVESVSVLSATDEEPVESSPSASRDIADLIDLALSSNPSTKKAWADMRSADFSVGTAEGALYPSLSFLEAVAYIDSKNTHLSATPVPTAGTQSAAATTASVQSLTASMASASGVVSALVTPAGYDKLIIHNLSFAYLLFDFGGRRANINAAHQALYAANWRRERAMQAVVISVLKNYYLYMGYKALVLARTGDVENASANFELAQRQFEAGIKTKLDVLQTSSSLIDAQSHLAEAIGRTNIAWGGLMTAIGMPATTVMEVADLPENLPMEEIRENVQQLVKMAEEQRPDLAATMADYKHAQEQVTIARSAGLPVLATAGYVTQYTFFNNPNLNLLYSQAVVGLSVPIFSGFSFEYQTKSAKAQAQSAFAQIEEKKLDVALDVAKSYYNFLTATERVKFSEEFVKYSQDAYNFAFISYKEGMTGIADLLLAQRNLASARAQKIETRTQWAVSLATLAFATGSL